LAHRTPKPYMPPVAQTPAPQPVMGPVLVVCSRCGQPMRPIAYFSRAFNVAKAVFLFIPFSIVGPLLFFLLRKDRLICSVCQSLLKNDAVVPFVQAFSPGGRMLAGYPSTSVAAGLTVYDPDEDQTALERQSRRCRTRARTWGAISAGLLGLGVTLAITGSEGGFAPFLVGGLPLGIGALFSHFKGRTYGRMAEAKRTHEHRACVLELARASGGRLSVSLVATELRIDLADAERLLSSMVDGQRVEMEVDDNGRIHYVFTELVERH